jgi:hypothetical protein
MPVEWRLHVLEERLKCDVDGPCTVESVDLIALTPVERTAALDAMVDLQTEFPITLVDGVVACTGDIDADAIVAAARSAHTAKRPEVRTAPGGCG